jgi:hypothetical protein
MAQLHHHEGVSVASRLEKDQEQVIEKLSLSIL